MSDPEQTMTRIAEHVLGHPAVVLDKGGIIGRAPDGSIETFARAQALGVLADGPCLVCHKTFLLERLGGPSVDKALLAKAGAVRHFDVCELFAFVAPAFSATPTPHGLARALGIAGSDGTELDTLDDVFKELAKRVSAPAYPNRPEAARLAGFLARTNWPFAELVESALYDSGTRKPSDEFSRGLNVWDQLDEWQDDGPRPPASQHGLDAQEVSAYLTQILGPDAEHRQAQFDYAQTAAAAFQPREAASANHIALAEAGTGLGKTLGYLAPAALWAQKNAASVWISTYTKNLQRQLEQESRRLFPEPEERHRKVVVRKGRENYACLLNMQETFDRLTATNANSALMSALIARWARYSRDGDMIGGDFPAWLMSLFFPERVRDGRQITPYALGLTDRRGECIYAVCPHYKKCFIEKNQRAARKAELVIANHALVMHQAALDQALGQQNQKNDEEDDEAPSGLRRLVFDEGHHVFDAADNAFSAHITGLETAELRRWVRGAETRNRRARSLMDRIGELIDDDPDAQDLLGDVEQAARHLPGPGWQARLEAGLPEGPAEAFLASVRTQVHARADVRAIGNLETDCRPVIDGLSETARDLSNLLAKLRDPMIALARMLSARLDTEAGELDTTTRVRIEALARSLNRRARLMISAWIDMLARLDGEDDAAFVEWFAVEMQFGREFDVGMHAHWVDPSEPLATTVLAPSDGVVVTSATLRDRPPEAPDDWEHAEMRTGAIHLPYSVHRASFASPFDYPNNSRILVVTDVGRENMDHLAAAYRELFLAAGGGALGLFTAISRLKAVFGRLAEPMADNGLALFAQHVDPIDTGTLVDMFRAQKNACLLGTDAVRDGVDVAGDALRLIVQDRVPWPQPTILERARRKAFGGAAWQDMAVRLRLRQAYGRLIRRKTDRGVFVLLDNRLASRFTTAFPDGVEVERMGLVEAIEAVAEFTGG